MSFTPQNTADVRWKMRQPLDDWSESSDFGVEYLEAQGLAGYSLLRNDGFWWDHRWR
jgi:hypothetical protein